MAANRRKAVLWLGIGIVVVTMLPVEAIYLGQAPFVRLAYSLGQMPPVAAQHAYAILFRNLVTAEQIAAFLGIVFVVGAIAAGPGEWAVALRRRVAGGLDKLGPGWDFGPVGEWISQHASRD